MIGRFEDNLPDLVDKITANYGEEEIFLAKGDLRVPTRSVVIEIINEFRKIMFPGYFGFELINSTNAGYFVGHTLTKINELLSQQITLALSYRNGGYSESICSKIADTSLEILNEIPHIQKKLLLDVEAACEGDPAAGSKEQVVSSYPGLYAIFVYRIAHELYLKDIPYIPRIMTEFAHSRTGIDINAGATIGNSFFIDHGTGVVIGETTVIGDRVKIYQGVTLGALSTKGGISLAGTRRHPTIEDDVTIYSGATILGGDTVIGKESIVGGNCFITKSIKAGTKVSIKNPEHNFKNGNCDYVENFDI